MIEPDARTRATWGDRPDPRPRMRLLDFKSVRKAKLFGFAKVELPNGLRISDIPVFAGKRGRFATMPARPVLDQEGRQKRDINGNPQYAVFLEWRDRDLASRFSDTVIALVLEAYPGAIE
jgi:DNA-binding cell septation regulator SpoVG